MVTILTCVCLFVCVCVCLQERDALTASLAEAQQQADSVTTEMQTAQQAWKDERATLREQVRSSLLDCTLTLIFCASLVRHCLQKPMSALFH